MPRLLIVLVAPIVALAVVLTPALPRTAEAAPPAGVVWLELVDAEQFVDAGQRLAVFVGETRCLLVDLATGVDVVELGTPDQPAACGEEGATITLVQFGAAEPRLLAEQPTFAGGTTIRIENFAPQPPGTPLPAFVQQGLLGGGVQPPTTGNAGLAAADDGFDASPALLALLTLGIVGAARASTRRR